MGFADKLKGLTKKAEDAAIEHKDEIQQAVQKAEVAADQRTGGKYHEQIQKAGTKADTLIEGLGKTEKPQTTEATAQEEGTPRAG